jgi:hypothetical protein
MNLVSPNLALDFLRAEFPAAHVASDYGNYRDFTIVGYVFRISGNTNGRTKYYAVNYGGCVDLDRVMLFRDGQAYARDKRNKKAAEKRARDAAMLASVEATEVF